jgi:hypothetical protein
MSIILRLRGGDCSTSTRKVHELDEEYEQLSAEFGVGDDLPEFEDLSENHGFSDDDDDDAHTEFLVSDFRPPNANDEPARDGGVRCSCHLEISGDWCTCTCHIGGPDVWHLPHDPVICEDVIVENEDLESDCHCLVPELCDDFCDCACHEDGSA